METPVNLEDFRALARARIPSQVFDYIDCGACDEITHLANRRDLEDIRLLPRCLRNVSEPKISVELIGQLFSCPMGFSPTAFHRLVHEAGEVATARAAKTLNVPMIVSCMSSVPLEDVARDSCNRDLWLQLYLFKDPEVTYRLAQCAEQSGYKALVVTVGCPVAGKRERNIRNGFSLPSNVTAANFKRRDVVIPNNPIHSIEGAELDPAVTWEDLAWLRGSTRLPIVLKGIMSPLDVAPALDLEVAGLIVSNHGGRQLDTCESTIRALPKVAAAVGGRIPLLVDSGFRRGTDILKALALGADAVLLGRPVVWALAVNGEIGVVAAIDILTEELRTAMQLCGCSTIEQLREVSADLLSTGPYHRW